MTVERQPRPSAAVQDAAHTALQELRAHYAQNDATMSEEFKAQFPILTFAEMVEQFPNEWIAFVATAPQFRQRDAQGRVVAHSADATTFHELTLAFHDAHPDLPLSTDYTGPYEFSGSIFDAMRKG
jgi:hypothetical protein